MNEPSKGAEFDLARRLVAEGLGTAMLLAGIVGSGIMAERLAGGNEAVALLANMAATGAILAVLILVFGYRCKVAICAMVPILGLANILSWALYREHGSIDNAIAWTVTLLILGYFFVTYFAWKQSGFQAKFTVSAS